MKLARTRGIALGGAVLLAIASFAMLLARASPIDGFSALLDGAFGGAPEIAETLVQTTLLLFPSLAVTLAFRAGLFNIGAEGQLIVGALCAGVVGANIGSWGALAIPVILLAGAAGGGAWGAIAGTIRARFGGNEMIATLMLNVLAVLLANGLLNGPLRRPDALGPATATIARAAWLPVILPDSRLTLAAPLALSVVLALWFFLSRTVAGYEWRAVGDAPEAARRAGIDAERVALLALTCSGAIAGLGGAILVDGVLHRFTADLSPGYGFTAIAVALVGGLEPLRVVLASLAFGALQNGALTMQALAHVPKDAITFLEGLAILGLAARR